MSSSIGLCFSGGGFRASFYALGVLRYLAEPNDYGYVEPTPTAIKSDPRTENLPEPRKARLLPSELVTPLALLRTDLARLGGRR